MTPSPDSGQSYYDTNYPDIDLQNSPNKLEFYLELVKRYVPPGSRIFELGVGMGHFLENARQQYECEGCDINAFGIEETKKRCGKIKLYQGSAETISAENKFQAIVSWDVLEHLPNLESQVLPLIYERLNEGSYLMAVVPVYDGPLGWLVHRLDKDPTHLWKWGRYDWQRLLEKTGFEVKELGGITRKLFGSHYVHLTQPQLFFRHVGNAIYFVAQKPISN